MSIKLINESFGKIAHPTPYTNKFREALGDGASEDKFALADALFNAVKTLKDKGVTELKEYEYALQAAIESQFPDTDWFDVTSVNIFWDLMNTKDPEQTAINILADIYRPEETVETEETVEVTEDTVKRGGKRMNVGKDGSHGVVYIGNAKIVSREELPKVGDKNERGDSTVTLVKRVADEDGHEIYHVYYTENDALDLIEPNEEPDVDTAIWSFAVPIDGSKKPMNETADGAQELWSQINNNEYAYNKLAKIVSDCSKKGWSRDKIVVAVRKAIYSMKDDFGRIYTTQEERHQLAKDFVDDELGSDKETVTESKKKCLKEGPGAGYWIKGTIENVNVKSFDAKRKGDEYDITADIDATFEDVSFESYYYGSKLDSSPIHITHLSLDAEVWGEPTKSDIEDALKGLNVTVLIGGGWSHTTFDGWIGARVEDIGTDYGDILSLTFEMTDKSDVKFIDKSVKGDTITTEIQVMTPDYEYLGSFDTLEDAKEFAEGNEDAAIIVEVTYEEDRNGNFNPIDDRILWKDTGKIDESVSKEKIMEACKRKNKKHLKEEFKASDKKASLAKYLGVPEETIKETRYDSNSFETEDGEEYLVLDEDEAHKYAKEDIEGVYDDLGMESFTKTFQEWILNNAVEKYWFEDALEESERSYIDNIEYEDDDTYGNRLVQEMVDAGILSDDDFEKDADGNVDYASLKDSTDMDSKKEDFLEYLVEQAGDPIQWYRGAFGDKDFSETVKENGLIDLDAVEDEAISLDGVAHFIATYDGEEIDLGDGLFAYRTN